MTKPGDNTDDDTGEDDTGTGAPDEGGDDEDEDDEPQPFVKADGKPFTKADYDALQAALKKSRREARAAKRGTPAGDEGDGEAAAQQAVQAAQQAATEKWKPMVVRTAARAVFAEAGLVADGGAMTKVLKMLDLDDLDVTDDGDVEGLEDQVEDIKRDFPALFGAVKQRTPRGDVGNKGDSGGGKKDSASARLVAMGRGRGGW